MDRKLLRVLRNFEYLHNAEETAFEMMVLLPGYRGFWSESWLVLNLQRFQDIIIVCMDGTLKYFCSF